MLIHLLKIEHVDHALSHLVFVIDSSSSAVNPAQLSCPPDLLATYFYASQRFFMVKYTATHGQSVLFLVSELASVGSSVLIKSVGVARSYPAFFHGLLIILMTTMFGVLQYKSV